MGIMHNDMDLLHDDDVVERDAADMDAEDSDSDSESDSEVETVALGKQPRKDAVYNEDGLREKLEDIAWPDDVEWIHRLNIDMEVAEDIDPHDDLVRELAFYTQGLDGVRSAFQKLQSMGMPFLRPPDYYAEMVKSDTHMTKVKGELLREKKRREEAEERKKARESKKMAKEVQAQKNKERAKRKREDFETVKKWRKQRQQSGFSKGEEGEDDIGLDFGGEERDSGGKGPNKKGGGGRLWPGASPGDRSGGFRKKFGGGGGGGKNRKREMKESKFGHGGRKGMKKQNTAETTDDLRGFNRSGDAKRRRK